MITGIIIELKERIRLYETAIRKHRESYHSGDDKCWKDNEELYKVLPEGYTPPVRDSTVELDNCQRYIASCHHPDVIYLSPQREIERLQKIIDDMENESRPRHR